MTDSSAVRRSSRRSTKKESMAAGGGASDGGSIINAAPYGVGDLVELKRNGEVSQVRLLGMNHNDGALSWTVEMIANGQRKLSAAAEWSQETVPESVLGAILEQNTLTLAHGGGDHNAKTKYQRSPSTTSLPSSVASAAGHKITSNAKSVSPSTLSTVVEDKINSTAATPQDDMLSSSEASSSKKTNSALALAREARSKRRQEHIETVYPTTVDNNKAKKKKQKKGDDTNLHVVRVPMLTGTLILYKGPHAPRRAEFVRKV